MINLVVLALTTTTLVAQELSVPSGPDATGSLRSPDSLTFSGRNGNLDVAVPRFENPDVRIDGRLDEAIWQRAALLSEFTQYEPIENIPSTEATEAYVFYSSDAIYFGIRAFDREPELIQARLGSGSRS